MTILNKFQCDICYDIIVYHGATMVFKQDNQTDGSVKYVYNSKKSSCELRADQYDQYVVKHICKNCMDSITALNEYKEKHNEKG